MWKRLSSAALRGGAGVDAKTVAGLMGHRNVTLTLTHYTHPDAASHRAAVARLPWQRAVGTAS